MQTLAPRRRRTLVDYAHYDFGGGVNIQDSPQELADNDLTQAINVYLENSGDVSVRRGMTNKGSQISATAAQGIYRFYQQISNGAVSTNKRTVMQVGATLYDPDTGAQLSATNKLGIGALPMSAVRVFDPSHATSPPSSVTLSAIGGGTLVAATYGYLVTAITPGGETLPTLETTITTTSTGTVRITFNTVSGATGYNVYGRTPGGELKIANNIAGPTFDDDGSVAPVGAFPTTTTATALASDILVMCTGVGGPYAYDGVITYTLPTGPTTITNPRWCALVNNVLYFAGLSNQPNLLVGSALGLPESQPGYATFSMSSQITGLGTLGVGLQTSLVVGMNSGLSLVTGFTPNTYIEQEIPNQDGVQAGRSMITIDGILYFIGNYAIYRYDGQAFTEISRKVRPWILNDALQQDYPMNGNRSTSWAMYWNRRIYFWYSSNNSSGPPNTALVFDLVRQGWTIYTGANLNAAAILNAPGDPTPATCVVCSASVGRQYNFDVFADGQFNVGDVGTPITATWLSKFFKIGDPGTQKHLLRVQLELFFLTNMNGQLNIVTDYGQVSSSQVLIASNPQALWDSATWDSSKWAGSTQNYIQQRYDVNITGEAFAFGFQTPNPNLVTPAVYQVWRCMGISGRISQQTRA